MPAETFPAAAECVSRARHDVGAFLNSGVPIDVTQMAMLLVSELSTNAVRHAHSPFTVSAMLAPGLLRVEVEDRDRRLPTVRHPGPTAVTGRGMLMVDALSARWGAEPTADGKRVWFELVVP